MNKNRVTLITLGVSDLDRAADYYQALGWVPEAKDQFAVFFDMDGQKFGLYLRSKLAEDLAKSESELGTGAMTLAQNYATETDVDAAYDKAVAAGATELKRPEKVFWGGYSGTLSDPDGHVWEYAFNPFWTLDENGRIA